MSVFETIKNVIVEVLDIAPEEITLESSFTDDLGADSLDVVEMLMLLEEKYELEIPEEVAENMKTVKDVVEYLEARLQGK
ncbi:MAG TPA: acyl carrier protein [Syntrophothermus lipocalidus]|uniref:Acyl carrier protein n=1 Tax=Syntrophothermus lipocalidus (strain DSM 12680 / TGB-C1) TaxID=643648 RepID=D7CNC4_SYNLT|nr:acyl carrier protein [Syntrophothermus lipocalidus]ADI02209.1 acyl carrier protein [Syntrophothermus lipocalidus DSM 12680]HHV75948.1 acyl carrier protein [Syntrophothermus lipocalidus]